MIFDPPLIPATLIKRYKRFLADVILEEPPNVPHELTVHCPNTGSMKHCWGPNWTVYLQDSNNPKRKYRHTWVIAQNEQNELIGVNTHLANKLIFEGIQQGVITELSKFNQLQTEVKYGTENSRIDILASNQEHSAYIEVKSVTLKESDGYGYFPDAKTERGQKHLRELIKVAQSPENEAWLVFCVQHSGIKEVKIAQHIDPEYSKLCVEARQSGVNIVAYACDMSPSKVEVSHSIPVILGPLQA